MKTTFNKADLYLIEHWKEALEFEAGMNKVREAHAEVGKAIEAEIKNCSWWEKDDFKCWVRPNYNGYGYVGFGKRSWDSTKSEDSFPGLWIAGISLDYLLDDAEELPTAYLWMNPIKKGRRDVEAVTLKIRAKAAPTLKNFPPRNQEVESEWAVIHYSFPEGKQTIRAKLLEGKPFVDLMIGHVNRLAELIPAVDRALKETAPK